MRKVIKDNKVAVIVGTSWYSLHNNLEWVFLPELVELIQSDEYQQMTEEVDYFHLERKSQMIVDCLLNLGYKFTEEDIVLNKDFIESNVNKYKDFDKPVFFAQHYIDGKLIDSYYLEVEWIDCDRDFTIIDFDHNEQVIYKNQFDWIHINTKPMSLYKQIINIFYYLSNILFTKKLK